MTARVQLRAPVDRGIRLVETPKPPLNPTELAYGELEAAFNCFNEKLFDGRLPRPLLTLQRRRNTYGYFAPQRFEHTAGEIEPVPEIALNPQLMRGRSPEENLGTLAHEMCHAEDDIAGTAPKRPGYHGRSWGKIMERIGLVPSTDGRPGGRKTGHRMSHYIAPGGTFERVCTEFLQHHRLSFVDRLAEAEGKPRAQKIAYRCETCRYVVRADKAGLPISCDDCRMPLTNSAGAALATAAE